MKIRIHDPSKDSAHQEYIVAILAPWRDDVGKDYYPQNIMEWEAALEKVDSPFLLSSAAKSLILSENWSQLEMLFKDEQEHEMRSRYMYLAQLVHAQEYLIKPATAFCESDRHIRRLAKNLECKYILPCDEPGMVLVHYEYWKRHKSE